MDGRIVYWAITSALAGFLFGFDTVVISGAEQTIQSLWGLSAGVHGIAMGAALYGTVVGSLVHADAAAELPMVLTLLGGSVTVRSTAGSRRIEADDLFVGPLESTVRHDEIALQAFFPALVAGEGVAFAEIARRHGDYALCGAGAVVRVDGEAVVSARVGYLSVCDVPTVVDLTEAWGSPDAAADLALARLGAADDLRRAAAYRSRLVRILTALVLQEAHDDARRRSSAGGRAESRP